MKKYPELTIDVEVEALGGVVTLKEFTQEYRVLCNNDKSFDTPRNALMMHGLTEEQVNKLGESVAKALYEEIIDLTYPNAREQLEKLIEDGEYTPPTEDEIEESKKNS